MVMSGSFPKIIYTKLHFNKQQSMHAHIFNLVFGI